MLSINAEVGKLRELAGWTEKAGTAFQGDVSVPALDQLEHLLDKWICDLNAHAAELEGVLSSLGHCTQVTEFYIGSDDDGSDTGGDQTAELLVEAEPYDLHLFEYGDLVCLEHDVEVPDGRSFHKGCQGRVCAVYHYDEMPLVEVQFFGQRKAYAMSDSDLRVLQKATKPPAVQVVRGNKQHLSSHCST